MEEHQQNGQGTDESHTEEIDAEERAADRPPVGELIVHNLLGHIPADKQTGEQATDRQEYLSGDKIEDVEQRLAKELQPIPRPKRQRAESTYHSAGDSDNGGRLTTRYMQFLLEKRGAHLMQRDERSERGQRQQHEEQHSHDITHDWHRRESLVEHIGQGDKHKRRTLTGVDSHRESGGKNHQSGKDGHQAVDKTDLKSRLRQIGMTAPTS